MDLRQKPILKLRPPKGVAGRVRATRTGGRGRARELENDSEEEEDWNDIVVPVAAGVMESDEESGGEENSSEELLFLEAATGEVEFEVERILDKEIRTCEEARCFISYFTRLTTANPRAGSQPSFWLVLKKL